MPAPRCRLRRQEFRWPGPAFSLFSVGLVSRCSASANRPSPLTSLDSTFRSALKLADCAILCVGLLARPNPGAGRFRSVLDRPPLQLKDPSRPSDDIRLTRLLLFECSGFGLAVERFSPALCASAAACASLSELLHGGC